MPERKPLARGGERRTEDERRTPPKLAPPSRTGEVRRNPFTLKAVACLGIPGLQPALLAIVRSSLHRNPMG